MGKVKISGPYSYMLGLEKKKRGGGFETLDPALSTPTVIQSPYLKCHAMGSVAGVCQVCQIKYLWVPGHEHR